MLIASRKPPEPTWTPVMGSEWLFAPIDRGMLIRARRAAREASQSDLSEGAEPLSAIDMIEEMGDAMTRALIIEGTKGWREVYVPALDENDEPRLHNGEPLFDLLPFTPDNLLLVLSDPIHVDALEEAYVMPFVLRERERAEPGNVSAASPNGIGEAATQDSDTATSPAKRRRVGGVRRAPTSSKSRAPRKKKTSGAS